MINSTTIDNIMQAARIEEVVGDFVTLRRRGINLVGLCPFHNEKTPSFTVTPTKGIYKCFGCGKGGNAVNFIMEHEHFTYPEALRYLARKYGIEVEEKQQTPEEVQQLNEKESLFNLTEFARQFFIQTLHESEEGKSIGMMYFRERGIRDDMVKKFQLGYSPGKWEAFSAHALRAGYRKEYLLKTGLAIEKENRLYDRFHGRVMFPIHSPAGRVVGFGGRILGSDKSQAKYVNSPESEIYNKSKTLYGIYFARNAMVREDNCLLVEGYTDVISLHQAGIENVVASSGTSLTQEQIRMIQRYTPNIAILYDGDPAGIKASFRGIDMILEQGMNVKIVLFPDGEDPDSFARKRHPSEVSAFISGNMVNFIRFKTKLLLDETKGDPIRKVSLVKEIVGTIALVPDHTLRSEYLKECSTVMDVAEQVLQNEMTRILRSKLIRPQPGTPPAPEIVPPEPAPPSPQPEIDPDSAEYQERELIRLLLLYGKQIIFIRLRREEEEIPVMVADYVVNDLQHDGMSFENERYQAVYEEYLKEAEADRIPDQEYFTSHANTAIAALAIDLISSPWELSPNWHKNNIMVTTEETRLLLHVNHSLMVFKNRKLERMISEKQKQLRDAVSEEEKTICLITIADLKKKSIRINKELNRIVVR